MSDDNFGPWIDWAGGPCPIPDAKAGEYELRLEKKRRHPSLNAMQWVWKRNQANGFNIIAYRVRIPADDLLRQAIEALRDTADFMERHSNRWDGSTKHPAVVIETARAVLTAYDKREQS